MVHQISRSPCRHNSPLEQARFDSQGNIESAFEALINCMNTRSLACENIVRFSRTPPLGCGLVEKKSRFPEEIYAAFYSGAKTDSPWI